MGPFTTHVRICNFPLSVQRTGFFFPIVPKKIFSKYPSNYFFFQKGTKREPIKLKIISEGTKLVFICLMQGLLLSFIVIAASKFLDFSSCPFVTPPPPRYYCI